ncbi:MAG TPA: [protein-PII] uridylyltransferase [Gammaproteobacteria bacterium]|nr:[protein-PII] uridylyltransferase [Gammaproteobacteria bacterium]
MTGQPAAEALAEAAALPASADLGAFRAARQAILETMRAGYRRRRPAVELVRAHAEATDALIERAWHLQAGELATSVALVAVGGYGRGELLPYSDIDLLVLLPAEPPSDWESRVSAFLTFLWDIGLHVGHSVRTVAECTAEAQADVTVLTTLSEARRLAGPEAVFEAMRVAIGPRRMWPSAAFFEAKMAEQQARHRKFHDTAYQLEPNVKESPGGLRDIQLIGWVAKRHFQVDTLDQLVDFGFLTRREARSLIGSQAFLFEIRCGLHLLTDRSEDRLLLDHQLRLAEHFGYRDVDNNRAVEQFMQRYYRTVKRIARLNEMLLQLFRESILYADDDLPPRPINARFQARRDYLEVVNDGVFRRYPFALLELFLLLQQHPELAGVRASTIRLIREHRSLIDGGFRGDLRCRSLFMSILREPSGPREALTRMNRYGILARYIPAFGRIVGRMQFDLFHVYTVDQHILFVLENVRRLQEGSLTRYPTACAVAERIPKIELLYLAALFHDIAKGRGGDHSELGSADALAFCRHHDLSRHDAELVAWLVEQHLVMSMTAQRRDISDPAEVHEFAAKVGSPSRLNHLFVLTVADMSATNPELLNSWKYTLLENLYQAAAAAFRRGLDNPADIGEQIAAHTHEALELLERAGVAPAQAAALWAHFPDDYFLRHQPDEIAWHTRAILERPGERPLIDTRVDEARGGNAILILAPDRNFLFAQVTGALARLGLTVQEARVHSTEDGWALDSYMVLDERSGLIREPRRLAEIRQALTAALQREEAEPPPVNRRRARSARCIPTPVQVRFLDHQVDHLTPLEVIAGDRPGLLSQVGQVFQAQHIRLNAAKVATLGERAEDVFFITGADGEPLEDPARREALRAGLIAALADDDNTPPAEDVYVI